MDCDIIDLNLNSLTDSSNQDPDNPYFIVSFPNIQNATEMVIEQVEIPFSYFVFDYTNNQINVVIGTNGASLTQGTYVCTIKPGTYNDTNIVLELESALATSQLSGSPVNISSYFQVWVDKTSSTLVFYAPKQSATNTVFSISFPSTSAPQYLGFTNTAAVAAVDAATTSLFDNDETEYTTGTYVESPAAVKLSGENQIYIHSDLASLQPFNSVRSASRGGSDIIGKVIVNNNYKGIIDNPFPLKPVRLQNASINAFNIYLTLGNRTEYNPSNSGSTTYARLMGQNFTIRLSIKVQCPSMTTPVTDGVGNNYLQTSSAANSMFRLPRSKYFNGILADNAAMRNRKKPLSKRKK
jgi:hypothetical protein